MFLLRTRNCEVEARCYVTSTVCLRPQCAVSSIFYSTVTLNFDLMTPKYDAFNHLCPKGISAVSLVKIHFQRYRVNVWDTRMDVWTGKKHIAFSHMMIHSASQKNPPWGLVQFSKTVGNFTCLLCIPIYARIRIFIQLPATLTKLCHIKHAVHIMCTKCPPSAKMHTGIFWHISETGIFSPNFTRLLNVYIYAWMQIFIQ